MERKSASIKALDSAFKETIAAIGISELNELSYDVVTAQLKSFGTINLQQILCIRCVVKGDHLEKFQHSVKLGDILMKVPTYYSSTTLPTNFLPWDIVRPETLEAVGNGNPILFENIGHTGFIIDINRLLSKVYPNIPSDHVFWCHDQDYKLTALPSGMSIYDTPWEAYPYELPAHDTRLFAMITCRVEEDELATATRADLGV